MEDLENTSATEANMDQDITMATEGTTEHGATPTVNNRKRKKSSRACDFCHVNHQPCDNVKPRCGYCEKHNKSCLYLRPQKKRGPAQGYRSALHTLRESAAAWGAALNLIPSLGPVIEGYLKQEEGQRLVKAVKDPTQQEFFIQAWQQSGVFKTFFSEEDGNDDSQQEQLPQPQQTLQQPQAQSSVYPDQHTQAQASRQQRPSDLDLNVNFDAYQPQQDMSQRSMHDPMSATSQTSDLSLTSPLQQMAPTSHPLDSFNMPLPNLYLPPSRKVGTNAHRVSKSSSGNSPLQFGKPRLRRGSFSLTDIVTKNNSGPVNGLTPTLGSLGFTPHESLEDLLDIGISPEDLDIPTTDKDPGLGTEQDQKAYYELLMGRQFMKDLNT